MVGAHGDTGKLQVNRDEVETGVIRDSLAQRMGEGRGKGVPRQIGDVGADEQVIRSDGGLRWEGNAEAIEAHFTDAAYGNDSIGWIVDNNVRRSECIGVHCFAEPDIDETDRSRHVSGGRGLCESRRDSVEDEREGVGVVRLAGNPVGVLIQLHSECIHEARQQIEVIRSVFGGGREGHFGYSFRRQCDR